MIGARSRILDAPMADIRMLLAIFRQGGIRIAGIHFDEQSVQCGDLSDELFIFRALESERQLIHLPLNVGARELFGQYEMDWHRRCIAQQGNGRQEQFLRIKPHLPVRILFALAEIACRRRLK
jgi:hypothetical protein